MEEAIQDAPFSRISKDYPSVIGCSQFLPLRGFREHWIWFVSCPLGIKVGVKAIPVNFIESSCMKRTLPSPGLRSVENLILDLASVKSSIFKKILRETVIVTAGLQAFCCERFQSFRGGRQLKI